MSLIYGDGRVICGPGNTPYIGENGNWWVGLLDLGVYAGSDVHYISTEEFKTATKEGVYFVSDDNTVIQQYYINDKGAKYPVMDKNVMIPVTGPNGNWWIGETDLGIPVTGDGSTIAGAAINDDSINGTTTYSSFKIENIRNELANQISATSGKNLEFIWEGTRLGVRTEGATDYRFTDLLGHPGLTGLDGSSITHAELVDGDLIVTVQDVSNDNERTVLMFEEDGVLTVAEMKEICASIDRLSREISNIKHSQYRSYTKLSTSTDGKYEHIITLNGTGSLQFILSKFKGSVKLSVDGNIYTATMNDIDKQSPYMLISLAPDNSGIFIDDLFTDGFTRSLDIPFSKGIMLEVLVDDNDEGCYPSILVQGTHYSIVNNSDDDTLEDYIPSEVVGDDEIDAMMQTLGLF